MAKKILMVEDSPSIRALMSFTLRGAGYDVIEAHDGIEALEIFNNNAVDMVITDCNMPKMDGLTLTRQLRSSPRNRFTPIVMLTRSRTTVCAARRAWPAPVVGSASRSSRTSCST